MPFIAFSMYKYKMKCRLKGEKMSEKNLLFSLKRNLYAKYCSKNDWLTVLEKISTTI